MIKYELHYKNAYTFGDWMLLSWSSYFKRAPDTLAEAVAFAKKIHPQWINGTQFKLIEVVTNEREVFISANNGTTSYLGRF